VTEPYAIFAASATAGLLLAVWAMGEAIVLPVVPDVLLGILVLAAPAQSPMLFAITVAAAVAGALVLWALLRHRPGLARRLIEAQPALGESGLREASDRLARRGPLRGFAQLGAGLPLKAYLAALARLAPATGYGPVAAYALVNRVARIGPPTVAFALAAPLVAQLGAGVDPALFGAVYFLGWGLFYAGYWRWRDPRRRSSPVAP
jgi:membrane protein YqaA with SNARE-associated domain